MNYTLEYRYPDGNDGSYPSKDLGPEEREHIEALLKYWDFPADDAPSEVVICLSQPEDDGEDINFPAEVPPWK